MNLCSWVAARPPSCGSGWSELRCTLPLPRFLVFLRYQCYYEYPLLTYLEYPILVAQGKRPPCAQPRPSGPHLLLTRSLSFPDLILLLCVFHFKGDVKQAAPYIVLYPFSICESEMELGVFLANRMLLSRVLYQICILLV